MHFSNCVLVKVASSIFNSKSAITVADVVNPTEVDTSNPKFVSLDGCFRSIHSEIFKSIAIQH